MHEVLYIRFTYTADANVATRYPLINFNNGAGLIYWQSHPQSVVTAGQTRIFYASTLQIQAATPYPNSLQIALPVVSNLPPGHQIAINADNLQAGDTLTDIYIGMYRHAQAG
jgi:hypothetical protein